MTTINVSLDQVLRSSYTRHGYDHLISDLEAQLLTCGLHVDVVEGSTEGSLSISDVGLGESVTSTSIFVGTTPTYKPWEVVIHDEGSVILPDYDLYYYHNGQPLLVGRGLVSYSLLVGMLISPVVYKA